jgi:hypothetical protein
MNGSMAMSFMIFMIFMGRKKHGLTMAQMGLRVKFDAGRIARKNEKYKICASVCNLILFPDILQSN